MLQKFFSDKHAATIAAIITGHNVLQITSKFSESFGPTELSKWMDTANGHIGGWYHRVQHGHDIAANLGPIYEKLGVGGLIKYPTEIAKDFLTPHGIPIPGTQFLVSNELIGAKFSTLWLSLNAADVFTGAIAATSTYRLIKIRRKKPLNNDELAWATIGAGAKIAAGALTTNPILIICGGVDTYLVVSECDHRKLLNKRLISKSIEKAREQIDSWQSEFEILKWQRIRKG